MFFGENTAARRARRPGSGSGPRTGRQWLASLARTGAVTAGAGLVLLSALAWTMPATVPASHPVEIRQQAVISYQAEARHSAAYPTGQVRTGDPVFLRLVPTLNVRIHYRAGAGASPGAGTRSSISGLGGSGLGGAGLGGSGLGGTRRVTAELRSSNGWHRGFELVPRARFTGGGFDASAPLDLARVRALVKGVTKATGVSNASFTLSVRSEIALNGTIAGHPRGTAVRESFFPELTFRYEAKQLQLSRLSPVSALWTGSGSSAGAGTSTGTGTSSGTGSGTSAGTGSATGAGSAVVRSRTSSALVAGSAPNRLQGAGLNLPVGAARTGGLIAGLVLLTAGGLAELARRRARRNGPDRTVRRIVLADTAAASKATRPSKAVARPRVPGPRTAALAERQWPQPAPRPRDRA
jgi:hypothetical protein